MTIDTGLADHLHRTDYPLTLAVLAELVGSRARRGELDGYMTTEYGAFVDWHALARENGFSTTEVAVLHMAHGAAIMERHGGGVPSRLAIPLRALVEDVL